MILVEKSVWTALGNCNPSIIHITFCQSAIVPADSDTHWHAIAHATSMTGAEYSLLNSQSIQWMHLYIPSTYVLRPLDVARLEIKRMAYGHVAFVTCSDIYRIYRYTTRESGPRLNTKIVFPCMVIFIITIRRSWVYEWIR